MVQLLDTYRPAGQRPPDVPPRSSSIWTGWRCRSQTPSRKVMESDHNLSPVCWWLTGKDLEEVFQDHATGPRQPPQLWEQFEISESVGGSASS